MKANSRGAFALATTLVLGLGLAGCGTSGSSGAEPYGMDSASMDLVGQASLDMGAATESLAFSKDGSIGAGEVVSQIIVSGDASIETSDPAKSATAFVEYVKAAGGSIDYSSQSEFESNPYASVTARIPADKFDEVMAGLDQFGKVTNSSVYNQEVGQQVAYLQARIGVLKDSIARLQDLMDQATTVDELIAAETSLTQRQSELDSLTAQLDWLSDQVSMSSLNVNFSTPATATSGFSLAKAWQVFLRSIEVVAYSAVVLVPWLVFAGAIAWAITAVVRGRRRKAKSKVVPPVEVAVLEVAEAATETVEPGETGETVEPGESKPRE